MRKTKITAIIMLIIASMLTSIVPVWAATTIDSIDEIPLGFGNNPSSTNVEYKPYIYGTNYGENGTDKDWGNSGKYGRKLSSRGFATLNYTEIDTVGGHNFAAYGIKYEEAQDISAYAGGSVSFGFHADTNEDTVSTENLYYALMTEGENGEVNFAGVPVDGNALEITTVKVPLSSFENIGSTGASTSINLKKFLGLGIVRMAYSGEGTADDSEGKIYLSKLAVRGIKAIDDLAAEIAGNVPVISFTKPTLETLEYTIVIEDDNGDERTVVLTAAEFDTEGGKYTWTDEAAQGQTTYTYKVILKETDENLTSESNEASATTPEDIGGEAAPDDAQDPSVLAVSVRNYVWSNGCEWVSACPGAYKENHGVFSIEQKPGFATENIFKVSLDYDKKFASAEDAGREASFLTDYFAVGFLAGGLTGGEDDDKQECENISHVSDNAVAVFRVLIDDTMDLTNAYFAIGQRWTHGQKDTVNYAGVPMSDYVSDDEKGQEKIVIIPLSDFSISNPVSFHKTWYYNWGEEGPQIVEDIDLAYFNFMGVIRDCSKEDKPETSGHIYISDMAVYDVKPVSDLSVVSKSPARVILGWEHSESLIEQYNIYRQVDNGEIELIGNTSLNRFLDPFNMESAEEVKYYVTAVAAVADAGIESSKAETIAKADNLASIDDLEAKNIERKPNISFTVPDAPGLTYTLEITGSDGSERSEDLYPEDAELSDGKYVWIDEEAEPEVTYTYKVIIEYRAIDFYAESNVVSNKAPEFIGGEKAPDDAKSSFITEVSVRNFETGKSSWEIDALGTKVNGDAYDSKAKLAELSRTDSILKANLDASNRYASEEESKADNPPSFFVDYYAVGFRTDKTKGGPDGTYERCINVASVAETGKVVYKVYIEKDVDLDNSYFAIGQRYYGGKDLNTRLNFAGVPMSKYVKESDKGKAITVIIPFSDYATANEGTFHKIWHYGYDTESWQESPAPDDKVDINLECLHFIGVIHDCTAESIGDVDKKDIYISDMGICDIKPVEKLEVVDSSEERVILQWDHAATLTEKYNIYRKDGDNKVLVGSTALNRFADERGFDIGETVTYYVSAVNEAGVESEMKSVETTIKEVGMPKNFRVENNYYEGSELSVNITWDLPSYGDIANYVLYRNGVAHATIEGDKTSYTDTSVTYSNEYTYSMQTVDTQGKTSLETEEITVTAAAIAPVTNLDKSATDDLVTFTWDDVDFAVKYEVTVNGQVAEVAASENPEYKITVPYKKEIVASVKAVNAAGAKSCINQLHEFALYDPAEKYESPIFEDSEAADYKIECAFDAEVEVTDEKSVVGSKSVWANFKKVSGNKLDMSIATAKWNAETYRRNNAKLTFWIYADKSARYENLDVAIQGPNTKIGGKDTPTRSFLDIEKYVTEKGKWVYVEVPFLDFPVDAIAERDGTKTYAEMDFAKAKGIAFVYDGTSVLTGDEFYFDDIKVKVNNEWADPTLADDAGNVFVSGDTISAATKSIAITFAEPMDETTLTTNNVWVQYIIPARPAEGDQPAQKEKIVVANSFNTYEDNVCTINFVEPLEKATTYTLHLVDVTSAKDITRDITGENAVSFTTGNEEATQEDMNALPVIRPVITSENTGSTVKVTVTMPEAPVYEVADYNVTITYDQTVLTPNASGVALKAFEGATVERLNNTITIKGNAGNKVLSGVLAEITFGVGKKAKGQLVKLEGEIGVVNAKADAVNNLKAVNTDTEIEVDAKGSSTGSGSNGGGGAGGGGGTADRDKGTIGGNVPVDVTGGESTSQSTVFTDVNSVPWATEAISALIKEGIISGYPDNTVKPEKTITREEFASLLIRVFGFKSELTESPFADVANDAWYANAIIVAHEKGIVSGVNDSDFGIGSTITREDMCTMIYRAMQASRMSAEDKYDEYQFADDGQISQYAKDAVTALYKSGVISGVSETEFAPKAEVNRAMAARVLYGIMGMM